MKLSRFFTLLFCLLIHTLSEGKSIIDLETTGEDYFLTNEKIEVLEDRDHQLTIQDASSSIYQNKYSKIKTEFPENEHPGSAYWVKFTVRNNSPNKNWLLECYNIKVSTIELFIPDGKGNFQVQKLGSSLNFAERNFNHKNFQFILPSLSSEPQTFYVRFISHDVSRVRLLIRSYQGFIAHAVNEYFLLGIFYGIIIIIGIYNLFLFKRLKDQAYLFYSIYAFSVGFFSMAQDGTGFHYIWPNFAFFNQHSIFFFSTLTVVFLLMYTQSFLETKVKFASLHKVINFVIIGRLILFFIEAFLLPQHINFLWIDILPFMLAYSAAIISYKNKNASALYFVIGFSILFVVFTVTTLRVFKILPSNIFTVYALNLGVVIEMILLSLALAERVKKIRENEFIAEELNKELELKVKERTDALMIQKNVIEEKAKALDTFIYKASHDIKGPLKSLIGVANMGLKDKKENADVYFEHTLKTAKKLDAIVKDLLLITKVNNANIDYSQIDFHNVINDVQDTLRRSPGYDQISFEIQIQDEIKFYSEKSIIYSIFQNFIENAIKYRNPRAKNSFLKIHINTDYNVAEIKFIDNGIGIPLEYQNKVFEMFFQIDSGTEDSTGLGLYIVKLSVEKLDGQIFLQSKHGEGTTFSLYLKNEIPLNETTVKKIV